MTKNIENWALKSLSEVEALSDQDLIQTYCELRTAVRIIKPMTDEMFWLVMVLPGEVKRRGLKV
jgi:hypothetical protein